MMKYYAIFLFVLITCNAFANDGAFYAKGNQLIPINESDISVKKEILTLRKIKNEYIEVTVYYEFFNPKENKRITVGFEAFSPSGDVEAAPKNGQHPYMSDFTVVLNNKELNYSVSHVKDSLYNNNGIIKSINLDTFKGSKSGNHVDFFYVYHFEADFKKGINILKHTYKYKLSGSTNNFYEFEYVLTAANRWANNQIDDFTLIVDNGEFETFSITKSFFKNANDWKIKGIGKKDDSGKKYFADEKDALKFHIQKGHITFQKRNFKPEGELYIYSVNYAGLGNINKIPFSYYQQDNILAPKNDFQKKILKNLPFARRGYLFKNKKLSNFYNKTEWYIPNPDYIPEIDKLTDKEIKWVEKWE